MGHKLSNSEVYVLFHCGYCLYLSLILGSDADNINEFECTLHETVFSEICIVCLSTPLLERRMCGEEQLA